MSNNIQSLLDRLREAALVLDEPRIDEMLSSINQQVASPNLRVLIVGAAGSGRASITNILLGKPGLLPESPIPKVPISLHLIYAERERIEVSYSDATVNGAPISKLKDLLIYNREKTDDCTGITVKTNSNILETSEIRIESIEAERPLMEWRELLANTDYAILVLKAAALLSQMEKEFIRNVLAPTLGFERVAIVVNQMDLVEEEERPSISALIRSFLGPFEGQPAIIEFSATESSKSLISGGASPNSGYQTIMALVKDDLIDNQHLLKSTAVRQAIEICSAEVFHAANLQLSVISTDQELLQELLDRFDARSQWIGYRIERSQNRMELLTGIIKEKFLREMESFGNTLRQQLTTEINMVENIADIKKYLPGYIQSLWESFLGSCLSDLRSELMKQMKSIGELVTEDLKEQFGNQATSFEALLSEFDPTHFQARTFIMPRRSNSTIASKAALCLDLGGVFVMISNPILGLTAVGAGQVIRIFNRHNFKSSEKRSISEAAITATHELEEQLKTQIEEQFTELSRSLNRAIADLYAEGTAHIRNALEESLARHKELSTRRSEIEQLINVTIPELKRQFNSLELKGSVVC